MGGNWDLHNSTYYFSQALGLLPPSLAAFCPWDRAILVCVGLGAHEEVIFYSLRQKQVCAFIIDAAL